MNVNCCIILPTSQAIASFVPRRKRALIYKRDDPPNHDDINAANIWGDQVTWNQPIIPQVQTKPHTLAAMMWKIAIQMVNSSSYDQINKYIRKWSDFMAIYQRKRKEISKQGRRELRERRPFLFIFLYEYQSQGTMICSYKKNMKNPRMGSSRFMWHNIWELWK